MKLIKQSSIGGLSVGVLVYESYDEADKAAGKPLAALDECNKNLVYRGALNDGRVIICDAVEKITGVKREYDPVMTKEKGPDGVHARWHWRGHQRWRVVGCVNATGIDPSRGIQA